jgi:hypothetical protein
MDTVIGLGNAGCNIAEEFAKFGQYKTYKLDVGLRPSPSTYKLERYEKIEDYEKNCPNLGSFFADATDDILFVLAGGGKVSSVSLAILEQLKPGRKISVLYIVPDTSFLGKEAKQLNNLTFNVLQEYARSGVLERLYLVDNERIDKIIPSASIRNYYINLNDAIVSSLHMINVFDHLNSVTDTFEAPPPGARISTLGFVDPKKNADKMFFSLDNVSDQVYYYAYNTSRLEEEGNLFAEIINSLKRKMKPDIRVSYGIFETDYEEDYVYCLNHTSAIQKKQEKDGGSEDLPTSP